MVSLLSSVCRKSSPLNLHVLSGLISGALLVYAITVLANILPAETSAPDLIIKELLTRYRQYARPEQLERHLFTFSAIASVAICIISIPLTGIILGVARRCSAERLVSLVVSSIVGVVPLVVLALCLMWIQTFFHSPSQGLLVAVLWIPLGVGVMLAFASLVGLRIRSRLNYRFSRVAFLFPYFRTCTIIAVSLVFLALASVWRFFGPGSITGIWVFIEHFSAVIFPQGQAYAGRAIFTDFPAQYGGYAQLLTPWFSLIGLSVESFTATLSGLVVVSIGCLFAFLRRYVNSLALFILGGATLVASCSVWYTVVFGFEPYFQYTPIRLLCPAIALLMFDRGPGRPDPGLSRRSSLLIGFFCAFSVAWNLDSGVVVLGTWIGLQAIELSRCALWLKPDQMLRRERWVRVTNLGIFCVGIVLLMSVFQLTIYWQSGEWPQWSRFVHYQSAFYYSGFNMLPMPRNFHFWMLVVGVYLTGLILGIGRSREYLTHDAFRPLLMLSVLGIGLFSYYQGRSHDYNLVWVIWPAILILFLLAQVAIDLFRERKLHFLQAFSFVGCVMGAGMLSLFFVVRGIPSLDRITRSHIKELHNPIPSLSDDIAFVAESLQGKKDCAIIADHQAIYEIELNLPSRWKGPGLQGVLFKSEIEVINDSLLNNPPEDIFVGPHGLVGPESDRESIHLTEILERGYKLVGQSKDGSLKHYKRK